MSEELRLGSHDWVGPLLKDFPEPRIGDLVREQGQGAAGLLAATCFGSITWSKALGRPHTAKLADAFVMEAWRIKEVGDNAGPGVEITHKIREPFLSLEWWDGRSDATTWRVAYWIRDVLPEARPVYISAALAPGIKWVGAQGGLAGLFHLGPRVIRPAETSFVKGEGPDVRDFEVVRRPLLLRWR